MSQLGIVLGFYQDREVAAAIVRTLHENGFARAALLYKGPDGRVAVEEKDVSDKTLIAAGGAVGLASSLLLPLVRRVSPVVMGTAAAGSTAAGAAAGWAVSRAIDLGVDDSVLKSYQKWVVRGEFLVLVQTPVPQIPAALSFICDAGEEKPTTFVVRPPHLHERSFRKGSGVPIRQEPLTSERLKEHAARFAASHLPMLARDGTGARGQALLRRLNENERVITRVSQDLSEAARLKQPISLSAEWVLDNSFVIRGHILDVRSNLSRNFYKQLPVLERVVEEPARSTQAVDSAKNKTVPRKQGHPRIYSIARELVARTDGRLDSTNITDFISAYQEVAPLTIGELWALPLMLRLALIENLRRLILQTDQRQRDRERADFWANRLLNASHRDPDQLLLLLSDMAQEQTKVRSHFADRLISHLYDEEAAQIPVRAWIERKMDAPLQDIIAREQRRHAADQISVSNSITSLRFFSQTDWREIFEELSLVDGVLRRDPAGVYGNMDFATRDNYRHQIERIERGARRVDPTVSEIGIAQRAVEAGLQESEGDNRTRHVGYYLVDKGQRELEEALQYQPLPGQQIARWLLDHPKPIYFGSIGSLSVGATAALYAAFRRGAVKPPGVLRWLTLLLSSDMSVQLVNYLVTRLVPPRPLPKMDFEHGIPDEWRTIVVVPMMLNSKDDIREEIERLEVHYLSNPDRNLRFALLADFVDAGAARTPEDTELLAAAVEDIEALNSRYGSKEKVPPFFLFHRERRWCESEQKWMGWERKRGKLEQLNHFLLNLDEHETVRADELHVAVGNVEALHGIKFVITLDADTQLPHSSARRLIETLAHPLNRPVVVSVPGSLPIVQDGYSIIQPLVSTTLPSAMATRFSRLFTDPKGSDPYTHVVSDVYQDLFGEGSYHGKGIYDLTAFHAVLDSRFPESTLLSHDLIEGAHARVGLASDIELYDQFPPNYATYSKRDHRWIRGDWQIAEWATPFVPLGNGGRVPNPLSLLNRWKIFDNLRRSLIAPGLVTFLVGGWVVSGSASAAAAVSAFAGIGLMLPTMVQVAHWLSTDPHRVRVAQRDIKATLLRTIVNTAFLPHRAGLTLDAIGRVLYRRFVSHRQMLEWQTAQSTYTDAARRNREFVRRMMGNSIFALGVGAAVVMLNPPAIAAAAPFITLWGMTPPIIHWLNGGQKRKPEQDISEDDRRMLRGVARQTWRFFDDFVGPQTNWLPPDNYQETWRVEIAQRTSPTNIGLWLLAVVTARDFGYLSVDDVVGRALGTLRTVDELERFNGHLLNWYNVQTLEILRPRYVSTVDSGNFLGSLWTLNQSCREMLTEPLLGPVVLEGLRDTLDLLRQSLTPTQTGGMVGDAVATLDALFSSPPTQPHEIIARLRTAVGSAEQLVLLLSTPVDGATPGPRESVDLAVSTSDPRFAISGPAYWAVQIEQQVRGWILCADRYLRWMEMLAAHPPEYFLPLGEAARACREEALKQAPSLEALGHGTVAPVVALLEMRPRNTRDAHGLPPSLSQWLDEFARVVADSQWLAGEVLADAESLLDHSRRLADEMDMRFLYDEDRKLFAVGYNADDVRRDSSYYDLLASECRLASFLAIARNEVPVEHWWKLSRRFGGDTGSPVLLSWSGTMFEYLMPLLLTQTFDNSLLDEACRAAVAEQIKYGRRQGFPWGISEAAFSELDANRIYQYKAFGVPGMGLQRGHDNDKVVAPYATALALMVDPRAAIDNLNSLAGIGARGDYGFYESVDFARQRLEDNDNDQSTPNPNGVIVRAYMAHHQGMSLISISNLLHGGIMQRRFHSDPYVRATTPLLYERIPVAPAILKDIFEETLPPQMMMERSSVVTPLGRFITPDTPLPRVHLLSNGKYSVMVTNAGGGYSRWNDLEITRWRADSTRDNWGSFCYVRDLESSVVWSTSHQPMKRAARQASVDFKAERAEFTRRDAEIETVTDVIVSPEDDAEIRRVTFINHSDRARHLEVTSYSELSLAPHNADRAHPAFNKLFIQTAALPQQSALLAWRRQRSASEATVWAAHILTCSVPCGPVQFETDRARFLGRGRTAEDPVALNTDLSGTAGAVLDPIFSLRQRVKVEPGQRVCLTFITGAAQTREGVMALVEKYSDPTATERAIDMAWTHAQLEMHHLRLQAEDGLIFEQLASYMLYPFAALRAPAKRLRQNQLGQSRLWAHGISGDLPILVVTIDHERDLNVVRQALMAHTYWRVRGFKADLVILNDQAGGYQQELSDQMKRVIAPYTQYTGVDQPGGVFVRSSDSISEEDMTLLLATARVVLVAARGSLGQQLSTPVATPDHPPRLVIARRHAEEPSAPLPFLELPYFNGIGGFTTDGEEYCTYLGPGTRTPAPWVNVMANPLFGALVSESGSGFSWYGNSQSNRLTPWSNDPVSDPPGEAIYIRDEESGVFWSPTPLPVRELDPYRSRHGQGYTAWEHNSHAIEQELITFVPAGDERNLPIRVQKLRLRNHSSRRRRLSVTSFHEWVLGTTKEETQTHVVTAWDTDSRTLMAHNAYHPDFGSRVGFASSCPAPEHFGADRTAFIGRNGSLENPTAMRRKHLVDRCGAGFDPCATLQVHVDLQPGEERVVTFLLGSAENVDDARHLVSRFRETGEVESVLTATREWWDDILSTLQVETPIQSANFLLNRWLVYQNLSCRIWGRSAFYQSGGAWGFRDQLQDMMGIVYSAPHLAREHILRAAAQQFEEGDVQHWWHPPSNAGVRTRITDDLLFLPYVVAHYIRVTGDASVLDENAGFLKAPLLEEDEHEKYFVPERSDEQASIFEHCRRAIEKGSTTGPHGLPLIGGGDWNDGMNKVGEEGKGESVWLAWFLIDVLNQFAELCEARKEKKLAKEYKARARKYAEAVEESAWDGAWYRRAYYDNGAPLGSHLSDEAKIDSLPQSWGVISGAARPERATQALQSVMEHLVKVDEKMILLFTPAFDKTPQNPGYIKGYLPGVRENGGQYTHGALWTALAFARFGDGDKAVELLQLLNPVEHARDTEQAELYKVEPYVVCADVYALEGQVGRGGWTWYTGSSGWMYRVWIEEVLGFQLRGDRLIIDPTIPSNWPEFTLRYRHRSTLYHIRVENPDGVKSGVLSVEIDGGRQEQNSIPLDSEGGECFVVVTMGVETRNNLVVEVPEYSGADAVNKPADESAGEATEEAAATTAETTDGSSSSNGRAEKDSVLVAKPAPEAVPES